MNKISTYFLYSILLICYVVTYHIIPLEHHHSITSGDELHVEATASHAKEFHESDSSVCLICLRINSSQVFSYDFTPFEAELTSSPFSVDDKPVQIISTEHVFASPRAPPVA